MSWEAITDESVQFMWRLAGKQNDLDRLVTEHLPQAMRFATRLTGDAESAEEIVQEALSRAARSWQTFEARSEFRTWLFRIIVNAFRDHLKDRRSDESLPDDAPDLKVVGPADECQSQELSEIVAQRVSALPARQREVVTLISYEGLSVREAAATLSITEANVHATLHVARTRLKRELAPYFSDHDTSSR